MAAAKKVDINFLIEKQDDFPPRWYLPAWAGRVECGGGSSGGSNSGAEGKDVVVLTDENFRFALRTYRFILIPDTCPCFQEVGAQLQQGLAG